MNRKNEPGFSLERFIVGPLAVNAYVLADAASKEACLIDPGADHRKIKAFITKNGFDLKFIINTHGHGDHIGSNEHFHVPIYIHSLDEDFLADADKNLSRAFFFSIKSPPASRLLKDGDSIELGNIRLDVLHTPGHTPGSISLKFNGIVFTGDTLFNMSVGRTDLDYGDEAALFDSIKNKLLVLPDDTVVYPGHGDPSTIGEEKRNNPFLN
ncbi:MAG: MBL fold metallo-hydrolase [Candidatus Omnitrophica bacterium]|nr:MBL fold metallo-hydrolase [Candidatus Omnitrophota bacterium]MDD5436987.1 MBL fold metallo-hydrolase [Candidatus Omnitrophota bacterium]